MRAVVLSDIHANLVALDAVLKHASDAGAIDAFWCLGDTVGYGPQPSDCMRRLGEAGALWVAGNHERAATGAIGVEEFNPDAAAAALWTRKRLSQEETALLDGLPEVQANDGCTLVHGTLRWPIWEYLVSEDEALAHLELMETPLGFVGHTHVPMLVVQERGRPDDCEMFRLRHGDSVRASAEGKMVINPGSVGQPRDGDPRASYAIYDTDTASVTISRVEYDVNATQKLMMEASLPRWLIERLSFGR
jgi:diadenosine tetraphosphatase ApaH/serine/threonine PP2A family protein phosphatase